MGAEKFGVQLKTFGFEVALMKPKRIINIYRDANYKISKVWRDANYYGQAAANNRQLQFGRKGIIQWMLPTSTDCAEWSKYFLRRLQEKQTEERSRIQLQSRRGRTRIYGGKVIENVCQAIARCIIGEQMLRLEEISSRVDRA